MIRSTTNINPIPMYLSKEDRYCERATRSVDVIIPYIYTKLPNFQISNLVGTTQGYEASVELYNLNDILVDTITTGFHVKTYNYSSSTCVAFQSPNVDVAIGDYYMKFTWERIDGLGEPYIYYSENFTLTDEQEQAVKITYWNASDLEYENEIILASVVRGGETVSLPFVVYLNSSIGHPSYPYFDTVQERLGITFPIQIISDKTYKFSFRTYEEQMDALRLIRLFDYIAIEHLGKTYKVINFDISDPEWEEDSSCIVECTFTVSSIVKKFESAVPTRGDFSDDFNDDFLI